MLKSLVGLAVTSLLLATGAAPATAQDIRLDISWGTPGLHAGVAFRSGGVLVVGHADGYRRPAPLPQRIERRHYAECVADGPYLYCWDAPRVYRGSAVVYGRPIVHVYVTDRAVARRFRPGARGRSRADLRQHEMAAARFWRRWADAHRYAYDRDRLMVDVTLAW
jgi:hypothetical protein